MAGKWGLRFAMKGDSIQVPSVGLRFFASDALALDLDAGLSLSHAASTTSISLGFGAAGQYYFGTASWPVRPFGVGRLNFGWLPYSYLNQVVIGESLQVGINGGAGLEYWPVRFLSVSGSMAAGVSIASVSANAGQFGSTSQTVITFGTVNPQLAVTLYTP
ncbi:MAG: hypothetical protein IRZ16_04550 [Myxococcaceae bacterium]|nr:hypothetical protein [Myxococcaceae bacterium]